MVFIITPRCALALAIDPAHAPDVALAINIAARLALASACALGIDLVTSGV